jgi:hypothetical protein
MSRRSKGLSYLSHMAGLATDCAYPGCDEKSTRYAQTPRTGRRTFPGFIWDGPVCDEHARRLRGRDPRIAVEPPLNLSR